MWSTIPTTLQSYIHFTFIFISWLIRSWHCIVLRTTPDCQCMNNYVIISRTLYVFSRSLFSVGVIEEVGGWRLIKHVLNKQYKTYFPIYNTYARGLDNENPHHPGKVGGYKMTLKSLSNQMNLQLRGIHYGHQFFPVFCRLFFWQS